MRTIFLMFDSLNKRFLESYGCEWVKTPNFKRLQNRCQTFENCFTASLPCMPARRDFQTGRISFLHRSWGPMEPYDNSVTQILSNNGIYTHLISDHIHYWEEGGANYHSKYDSWDLVRGQEGDNWKPSIEKPNLENQIGRKDIYRMNDMVNRKTMKQTGVYPIDEINEKALNFIEEEHGKDNWFLQVESFDPHEPFFAHERFREMYKDNYNGAEFDWPDYSKVIETKEQVKHCRNEYAALVSACDDLLGNILDAMDKHQMWKDTMLILTTDHGYLLGEHDWWGKSVQPLYTEVSEVPLFIYHPKLANQERRQNQLVQITDIAPTLLSAYNLEIPKEMTGKAIDFSKDDGVGRNKKSLITGIHGCYMNVTDGKYYYMKKPVSTELYNYTLMPSHMHEAFSLEEIRTMTIEAPFAFTKETPQMKINAKPWSDIDFEAYGDLLFDLELDPYCNHPIQNDIVRKKLDKEIIKHLQANSAPKEAYNYWGV